DPTAISPVTGFARRSAVFRRFRDAAGFLRRSEDPLRTLFWGGVYVALSPFVVPGLVVAGYQLDVLAAAADGDKAPPPLGPKRRYAVRGIRAVLITALYSVVPLAAVAAVVARSVRFGSGLVPAVSVAPVDAVTGVVAAYAPFLLVPAALVAYARADRLSAAFSPSAIIRPLSGWRYLAATVATFVFAVVLLVFLPVATVLTYGSMIVVVPFLLFYAHFTAGYVVGTAYGEAVGDIEPGTTGQVSFAEEDADADGSEPDRF
ncbi:MAG: DUF4013 domain-containing protein, partial [Haloferacaceae archaeon]